MPDPLRLRDLDNWWGTSEEWPSRSALLWDWGPSRNPRHVRRSWYPEGMDTPPGVQVLAQAEMK